MLPSLKALYHIGKTGTAFRQVRRIDLRDIAEAHDFGPRAGACDERLHLFGREVLWMDYFKLRASWGQMGNDKVSG